VEELDEVFDAKDPGRPAERLLRLSSRARAMRRALRIFHFSRGAAYLFCLSLSQRIDQKWWYVTLDSILGSKQGNR
jgi:hypothetical protein